VNVRARPLAWSVAALLAAAGAAQAPPVRAQAVEQAPHSALTSDLAALCAAAPVDATGAAARAWCHGFIVSAAQYHGSLAAANPATARVFCVPVPDSLTLDQVRNAFVAWSRSNPQYARDRAIDGLMRFAAATWPCPQASPSAAPARNRR